MIFAGDQKVEICVTEIDKGKVRIGFISDRCVEIYRKELLEKTEEE